MPDRPEELYSMTVRMPTTLGTMFVTVTYNDNLEILETIINAGKAGAESQTLAEGLGRMISIVLRHDCCHSHDERLAEVIAQLKGVTSVKRGDTTSIPDSLAKALKEAQSVIERAGYCKEEL
jgi:hypothetical protein